MYMDQTIAEEGLNGVRGWLMLYVASKYIGVVTGPLLVGYLLGTAAMKGHLLSYASLLILLLFAVRIVTGVTAATAVLRISQRALQFVGFDLLYSFIALVISVIIGIAKVGQRFPLEASVGEVAALWTWFQYFRVSRRVHATFERNLGDAAV